jgi:hypothetical protein
VVALVGGINLLQICRQLLEAAVEVNLLMLIYLHLVLPDKVKMAELTQPHPPAQVAAEPVLLDQLTQVPV